MAGDAAGQTHNYDTEGPRIMARTPLTLDQVIQQLTELSITHPECRQRPVQLLVINGTGLPVDIFAECHDPAEGVRATLIADTDADPTGTADSSQRRS